MPEWGFYMKNDIFIYMEEWLYLLKKLSVPFLTQVFNRLIIEFIF